MKYPFVFFLSVLACQNNGSNPKKAVVFQVENVKVYQFELEKDLIRAIPAIRYRPVPDTAINDFLDAYEEKQFIIQHALSLGYDNKKVADEVEAARRFFSIKNYLKTQKGKLRDGGTASLYEDIPQVAFDINYEVFKKLERHVDAFADPLNIRNRELAYLFPEILVSYEKGHHRKSETVEDFVYFYANQLLITPIKESGTLYDQIGAMARNQVMYDHVRQLGVHQADTLLIGLEMYRKRAIFNKYLNAEIGKNMDLSEREMRGFYRDHKEEYQQPEEVSIVLYRFASEQEAMDAMPSIMALQQEEKDSTGEKHTIRYDSKGYSPALKKEVFKAALDYVSYPIENQQDGTFLLFVKTGEVGKRYPSYHEVADLVRKKCSEERKRAKIKSRADSLKGIYKVVVPLDRRSSLDRFYAKYRSS